MALKNTQQTYASLAKFFHWTVFILVVALICVGPFMSDIADKALKSQVFGLHESFGLTVLALMFLRAIWALMNPKPTLEGVKPWEKLAERCVHLSLYLALIVMPLFGWMMAVSAGFAPKYFGLFTLPIPGMHKDKALKHFFNSAHTYTAWVIGFLVTIHVLAALKHHYIDKDNMLKRMMPGKG